MARKLKEYRHPKYDHDKIFIKVDSDTGTFSAVYEDKTYRSADLKDLEKALTDYISSTNNEVYTPVIMIQIDKVPSIKKWRDPDTWRDGEVSFSMKVQRQFIVKRGGEWQCVTLWESPFIKPGARLKVDDRPKPYYFDHPDEVPEKAYGVSRLDWGYISKDNVIEDLPLRRFRNKSRGGSSHDACIMLPYSAEMWDRLKDFESKFKTFMSVLYELLVPIGEDESMLQGKFFTDTAVRLLPEYENKTDEVE